MFCVSRKKTKSFLPVLGAGSQTPIFPVVLLLYILKVFTVGFVHISFIV